LIRPLRLCIAVWITIYILWLFFDLSCAEASGTGLSTFGVPLPSIAKETLSRQRITLKFIGGQLLGHPLYGSIQLLVLDAPGLQEGNVILRETIGTDGTKTLLLSSPDAIAKKIRRGTVFVKCLPENEVLAELDNSEWVLHEPQRVYTSALRLVYGKAKELYAFPISTLGPFRLMQKKSKKVFSLSGNLESVGHNRGSSGIYIGLWNIVFPLLLLLLLGCISRLLHAFTHRLEKP
jgi:hypothetical protein